MKEPVRPLFGPAVMLTSTLTPPAGLLPFRTVTVNGWVAPTTFTAEGGAIEQLGCSLVHVFVAVHENATPLMEPLASMVSVPGPPLPV